LRLNLILISNTNLIFSGFICYLFIIVFIGGLIVLLVRVTSTVSQEQRIDFSKLFSFVVILFCCYSFIVDSIIGRHFYETTTELISFLDLTNLRVVITILVLLSICLFILTKLLLDYKGIARIL